MLFGIDNLVTRCGNCKYYKPARSLATGRALPSMAGSCSFVIEWPKIPEAFTISHTRRAMWKGSGTHCLTFEIKFKKKRGPEVDTPNML